MNSISVDDIIDQALRQPEKERARIAEILISSPEKSVDRDIELAWQEEVARRSKEIDSGTVKCIPWEEVRDKVRRNASVEN
jgi:putative addiction module component (TIGR02574 family)